MDEKGNIKVSLGTVICIVIIILLIVALFGMWYYYNNVVDNKNGNAENAYTTNNNETIQNEQANSELENIKKINKIYEEKDIVYSSYSKYSSEYSYSIPYINIKSLDVEKINQEIENHYKPLIEEELENEKEGLSVIMGNIKYNSYLNNNILSLVISNLYPNDCIYYKVYNVDIYTGENISNSEIINQKNITENEFINKLNILYKDEFTNTYGSQDKYINNLRNAPAGWTEKELKEQASFYEEQLNKTISKDNYSIKTPIFLGENGNINVIAQIYSLAGAEYYYHIINMGI